MERQVNYNLYYVVLVIICLTTGCTKDSAETEIKKQITKMVTAVEEKKGRDFIAYLDDEFQDQDGRDKRKIRGILTAIFLQNKPISLNYNLDKLQVLNNTAQSTVSLKNIDGRLFRMNASQLIIKSQWRKKDNEWLIYRTNWERVK